MLSVFLPLVWPSGVPRPWMRVNRARKERSPRLLTRNNEQDGNLFHLMRTIFGKRQPAQPLLCYFSGVLIPDTGSKLTRWIGCLRWLLNFPLGRTVDIVPISAHSCNINRDPPLSEEITSVIRRLKSAKSQVKTKPRQKCIRCALQCLPNHLIPYSS